MRWLALAWLAVACATQASMAPVTHSHAPDAQQVYLHRLGREAPGRTVLIVPEFGFDERLVLPLAERVHAAGFVVHVLGEGRVPRKSLADFILDVRAAVEESGAERVLGIGVAGAVAAWGLSSSPIDGMLLVNAPFELRLSNVALADAFAAHGFSPTAWSRTGWGGLLLGSGRSTSSAALRAFERLAVPLDEELRRELARAYLVGLRIESPAVPTRLLVGVKDNLAEAHLSLLARSEKTVSARRMGRIEGFAFDVGHLDWLVDPAVARDVWPVVLDELDELEALR